MDPRSSRGSQRFRFKLEQLALLFLSSNPSVDLFFEHIKRHGAGF
jgi:hypothetical protein